MTFKKVTLTAISFLFLIIGLIIVTSAFGENDAHSLLFSIYTNSVFFTKLFLAWFICNKILMYFSLSKLRSAFFLLFSFYSIVQAGAYIETGEYLVSSHFSLMIHSFSDTIIVILGSVNLLSIILLLVLIAVVCADYYFHKKYQFNNKALYIFSVYLALNLIVITVLSLLSSNQNKDIEGFNGVLASLSEKELTKQADYNVLIFIYESLSWDYSSFSEKYNNTPYLKELSLDGVEFENMNAFTPHSSKSIFSILCGTPPILNQKILETASNLEVTCLPHLFRGQGYDTTFIQTASGGFEARPRLVDVMGFNNFYAREDLRSPKLGYLSSDDAKLYSQYKNMTQSDTPFFVTLFTSAPHHPYVIPKNSDFKNIKKVGDHGRYLELQREADATFGKIVADLKSKGEYDNTLIIAVADHGEGFGVNNVKQHDSNFYDEGIHVPAVVKFPKQFRIKPKLVGDQYSLVDLSHFVLDKLNENKLNKIINFKKKNAPVYINCWNDKKCFGWKTDDEKIILFPKSNKTKVFKEINNEPTELIEERASLGSEIKRMNAVFSQYYKIDWVPRYKLVEFKNEKSRWKCKKNKGCRFYKIK